MILEIEEWYDRPSQFELPSGDAVSGWILLPQLQVVEEGV